MGIARHGEVRRRRARRRIAAAFLTVAVLAGLVLNAALGWWWADPATGFVLVYFAVKKS